MELVQIGGVNYAIGLHWEHHDAMPSAAAIRAIADKEGGWVVRRRGMSIVQTGYGAPLPGVRPGSLYSLAALVADVKSEPWLGIVDLGDGRFWFIAVRDNNGILPHGDRVGTASEIQQLREEAASMGQWQEFPDWTLADLEAILATVQPSRETLRDAYKKPWLAPAIAGGTLLLCAGAGMAFWHHHEEVEAQRRAMILARARAIQAALRARQTHYIMPWSQTGFPAAVYRACQRVVWGLPASWQGWAPVSVTCTAAPWTNQPQAQSAPSKARTTVRAVVLWHIQTGGSPLAGPPGHLHPHGYTQTTTKIVTVARATNTRLLSRQASLRRLYGTLRPLWNVVTTQAPGGAAAAHRLPGQTAPVAAQPTGTALPWNRIGVTLQIKDGALRGIARALDAVPGLRLTTLQTKAQGQMLLGAQWTLQGILYSQKNKQAPIAHSPYPAPR